METNKRVKYARMIYFILAILFTLCIIVQFYLAGVATFLNAEAWIKHVLFVHLFGFNLPIFMLIFAIIGALPQWAYWQLFGVFASIFLMYFTVNVNTIAPWFGPLHIIVGILLFTLSCAIAFKSWHFFFKHTKRKQEKI